MKRKLPTLLAALSLVGVILASTSTGNTTTTQPLQDPPADDIAFEEAQTAKLLGVPLEKFPAPQGLNGMDEIPATARPFTFTLQSQPVSRPPPRVSFKTRKIVKAVAPDGSTYEAYCGRDDDDPREVVPDRGFVSTFENRRQWYENHYGYGFMPANVYVGKRERGLIKPSLFFRDVGSHETAPHALAIDSRGMIHLAVADVNISQDNRLDMYSVIGDPKAGKWTSAWLIDRRGFTSQSSPWTGAWRDKVHLLWDWSDVSIHKNAPGMGAYHVEWSPNGFGRKTRIFISPVGELDAAVDQESGLLVIVLAKDDGGVYVLSRSADGNWTRPSLLHPTLTGHNDVSIAAAGNGAFVIRTDSSWVGGDSAKTKEWLLRPMQ
jgi:hypothetical protein